jgi:molybdopterin-containing oxidoreductase family iron-sulfur binding subunit
LTRFLRQIGVGETLGLGKKPEDKTEYPLMLQFNPDVTVRSRGVMEKCSFCVHKIRRWHQDERALGRDLPETSKQTACQQACPADAITFGNMLDESSQVSQNLEKKGAYRVLDELNTKSNVTYLTRIRNRDMPEHAKPAHDSHGGGHDDHSSEPAHH